MCVCVVTYETSAGNDFERISSINCKSEHADDSEQKIAKANTFPMYLSITTSASNLQLSTDDNLSFLPLFTSFHFFISSFYTARHRPCVAPSRRVISHVRPHSLNYSFLSPSFQSLFPHGPSYLKALILPSTFPLSIAVSLSVFPRPFSSPVSPPYRPSDQRASPLYPIILQLLMCFLPFNLSLPFHPGKQCESSFFRKLSSPPLLIPRGFEHTYLYVLLKSFLIPFQDPGSFLAYRNCSPFPLSPL